MRPAGSCEIIDLKDLRVTPASLRLRKIIITASVCYIFLFTPILGYVVWNYMMAQPRLEEFEMHSDINTTRCPTVRQLPHQRGLMFPFRHQVINPRAHPRPTVLSKYVVLEKIRHAEDVTAKVLTASVRYDATPWHAVVTSAPPVKVNVNGTEAPRPGDLRELLIRNRQKGFLANFPVKLERQEEAVISDVTGKVPHGDFQNITEAALAERARFQPDNVRWITRVPNLDFPVVPGRYGREYGRFRRRRPVYLPENRTLDEIRKKREEKLMRRIRNYRSRAMLSEEPRPSGRSRIDIGFQERDSNHIPRQAFEEQRRDRKKQNDESNEVLSLSEFFKKHWTTLKKNLKSAGRSMNEKVRRRTEHGTEYGGAHGRQLVIDYLTSNGTEEMGKVARVRGFPVDLSPEDWPRKGSQTTVRSTRVRYNDFQHSYLVPRGKEWDFYAPLKSSGETSWEDAVREQAFYSPKPLSDLPWSEMEALTSDKEQRASSEILARHNATDVLLGNTEGVGRESAAGNGSAFNDTTGVKIKIEVRKKNISVLHLLPTGVPTQTTAIRIDGLINGDVSGVQHGPLVSDESASAKQAKNDSLNPEATVEPATDGGLRTEKPTVARTNTVPALLEELKTASESRGSRYTNITQDVSRSSGTASAASVMPGGSPGSLPTEMTFSGHQVRDSTEPSTSYSHGNNISSYSALSTPNGTTVSNQSAVGTELVGTSGAGSSKNAPDHSTSDTDVVRSSSVPGTTSGKDVSFEDPTYQSNNTIIVRKFSQDEGPSSTLNFSTPGTVSTSSTKDFAISESKNSIGPSHTKDKAGMIDLESTARSSAPAVGGSTEQRVTDGTAGKSGLKEGGWLSTKSFGKAGEVDDVGPAQQTEHSSAGSSQSESSSVQSTVQDSKQQTAGTFAAKTTGDGNKGNKPSRASSSDEITTLEHEHVTTKTEVKVSEEKRTETGASKESSGPALQMATADTGRRDTPTLMSEPSGTTVGTESSATPTRNLRNASWNETVDAEMQPAPASKSLHDLPDTGRSSRSATEEQAPSSKSQAAAHSSEASVVQNSTISNVLEASTTPPRSSILAASDVSASPTETPVTKGSTSIWQSSSTASTVRSPETSAKDGQVTTVEQKSRTSSAVQEDSSPSLSGRLGAESSSTSLTSGKGSEGTSSGRATSSGLPGQEDVSRDYREGAVATQETTVRTSEPAPSPQRPAKETATVLSSPVLQTAEPTAGSEKAPSVRTSTQPEEPKKTSAVPEGFKEGRQEPGEATKVGTEDDDSAVHFPTKKIVRTVEKPTTAQHVGIFDMFARGGSRHGSKYRHRRSWKQSTVPPEPLRPIQVTLFGGGFYARTVDAVRISVRRGKKIVRD